MTVTDQRKFLLAAVLLTSMEKTYRNDNLMIKLVF